MELDTRKKLLCYLGIPLLIGLLLLLRWNTLESFSLLRYSLLLGLGYLAALWDVWEKRIPNKLILFMLGAWVVAMLPKLLLDTEVAILLLKDASLGFLLGGGLFLLVYLISRKGLGGGDVKFMAATGLYVGFSEVLSVMLYGAVLSALTALALLLCKKVGRKDEIALAPFLYLGILLVVFFGGGY